MMPSEYIEQLCLAMVAHQASDLFLHEDQLPQLRIASLMNTVGETPLTSSDIDSLWRACRVPDSAIDYDASHVSDSGVRFRVNFFRSVGRRGAVLRMIKTEPPSMSALGLPEELLVNWVSRKAGLVLITGATGSGKSTTLASMLHWLNDNLPRHIVTIEDPIEYLFESKLSLFTQREVGTDTTSFTEGLRRALRQSPDVILLGEIRDPDTAITALQACETGHLVLATLHGSNITDTIERVIRLFPAAERESSLYVLSTQLIGILSQKLIPNIQGSVSLAAEYVENEGVTRKWILEGKTHELNDYVTRGVNPKNTSFLASLVRLCKAGEISEETGASICGNPHEFYRAIQGISNTSSSTITLRRTTT